MVGGPGVEPRGLPFIFYICQCEPTDGGHVAPMHWATCLLIICHENGHVSTYHSSTSTNENAPTNNQPIYAMSSNYHIIMMVRPSTWPYRLYGQVQSASQIFTCLAWRTDRDISSIRTPFAKVNIPPESGRRDGRNGTVFVTF
jgi:hypothetical protein